MIRLLKMRRLNAQLDRLVGEQASEWVGVMRKPGLLDRFIFARWLKQNERHAMEYLCMEAVDRALQGIDPAHRHDVNALLQEPSSHVVSLRSTDDSTRKPGIRGWVPASLAAAVLLALALAWWAIPLLTSKTYSTAIGEQRTVKLEDGSLVNLNTASRMSVRMNGSKRDIRLLQGEALFTVARDARRPFRVEADDTVIRALGTQFNVYRRADEIQVAVLEGRVEVSSERRTGRVQSAVSLAAGEEARAISHRPIVKQANADIVRSTAWKQRHLMFRLDTLADIATEFNRYNRAPRIRVEGAAAQGRRFSGVFDADDPGALAQSLQGDETLQIERKPQEIEIRAR